MDKTTKNLPLLTESQVANILGCKVRALQRWRLTGEGPVFRKIGRLVRYHPQDLDDFIEASKRRSTSDTGQSRS